MIGAVKRLLNILAAISLLAYTGTGCTRTGGMPADGAVIPTSNMAIARAAHTATLLPSGKVLIAGGMQRSEAFSNSVELYDPTTGIFAATGNMTTRRAGHTATLLPTGKVLIAGGSNGEWLASCELYDPATGRFTPAGNLSVRRGGSTATLLRNGTVLFTGGFDGDLHSSAEVFDPATATFRPVGKMSAGRSSHTATLLPDGKVLITGGGASRNVLASADVYNPATGTFTPTGHMSVPRHKHTAVLLPDGKVLILGGSDNRDSRGQYASAEIYNPVTGTFTASANMSAGRFKFSGAVATLKSGQILVAGGGMQLEIYDATTRGFMLVGGQVDTARHFSTATLLPDGKVLIAGGYDNRIVASSRTWVYKP
jgi:WD40 repeat protein